MVRHNNSLFHLTNKKKSKYQKIFDKFMFPIGLIGPFMMLPQVLKVYILKDVSSIAISSWILFLFMAFAWVIYGIMHKQKVLIVTNIAWIICDILMIIAVFIF